MDFLSLELLPRWSKRARVHIKMYDSSDLKLLIRSQATAKIQRLSCSFEREFRFVVCFFIGFLKRPTDDPLHATYASFLSRNLNTPAMETRRISEAGT